MAVHIVIAVVSLTISSYAAVRPSRALLGLSYTFATLTLASGVMLVVANYSAMPQACLSGLLFSVVTVGLGAVARRRLNAAA